jgi:hypothetical protein
VSSHHQERIENHGEAQSENEAGENPIEAKGRTAESHRALGRRDQTDGGTEGRCSGDPASAHLAVAGNISRKYESERMME